MPHPDEVRIEGIYQSRELVYRHLKRTLLSSYPLLDAYLGCSTFVKHENQNPTGSFKIRGGLNLIGNLTAEEKRNGVVTATRGNHGQSIALASRLFGIEATVVVPHGNNPEKNEAMRAYGANLLEHGRDFDEAREKVEQLEQQKGLRYIHSANEPMLIHGVGTYSLEIMEDLPRPDYIFVPVGGGSGVCSVITVVRANAAGCRVVGVQAEEAPSIYLSWKKGGMVTTPSADTIADGLATRVPFQLTFSIIRRSVDDIVTVSEDEIEQGVYQFFRTTHNVAEGAAAATLAAAYKMRAQLSGRRVVLILTGGNITADLFSRILARFSNA